MALVGRCWAGGVWVRPTDLLGRQPMHGLFGANRAGPPTAKVFPQVVGRLQQGSKNLSGVTGARQH